MKALRLSPLLLACTLAWSVLLAGSVSAQEGYLNRGAALLASLSYAYQLPAADLADRFGGHFSLGGGLDYLTKENQWILGLHGAYAFGNVVREDVVSNLRSPEGYIYGNNLGVADLGLRHRGYYLGVRGGKLFGLAPDNPRSGIRLTLGLGFWQHWIRISEDPSNVVPQLTGAYREGYDRLTHGLALQQFVGYQVLSNDGRLNFFAGVELMQGFTRHQRAMRFHTGDPGNPARLDLSFGLRVGWILPFYLGGGEDIYY